MVRTRDIRKLRVRLGLSRSEFARFVGVSDATVVRWESDGVITEPRGVQAVILAALADASTDHPPEDIARVVRSCGLDHRVALKELLDAAG